MLRKEAAADSDEEKFDIFQTFVSKELRLRSLIYGVELKKEAAKEVKKAASLADIQAVLPKSALPTTGANVGVDKLDEPVRSAAELALAPVSAQTPPANPSTTTTQAPAQPNIIPQEPKLATSKPASIIPPLAPQAVGRPPLEDRRKSKDDGYVLVASVGWRRGIIALEVGR